MRPKASSQPVAPAMMLAIVIVAFLIANAGAGRHAPVSAVTPPTSVPAAALAEDACDELLSLRFNCSQLKDSDSCRDALRLMKRCKVKDVRGSVRKRLRALVIDDARQRLARCRQHTGPWQNDAVILASLPQAYKDAGLTYKDVGTSKEEVTSFIEEATELPANQKQVASSTPIHQD